MRVLRPVDERQRRIAQNEAIFRELNERIEKLADDLSLQDGPLELVCECGDLSCLDHIQVAPAEYRDVRGNPTLFLLRPGHEIPDVDEVVERREGYTVVRKFAGDPAQLADEATPQS